MTGSELITLLVIAAVLVLLVAVGLNDRRLRRVGSTPLSGAFTAIDQVFHPEAAKAMEIREVQREIPADAPAHGDPLAPEGSITISLPRDRSESDLEAP